MRAVVMTDHAAKNGTPKIVGKCPLPLTGAGVVNRIITDLAVLDVTPDGLRLVEIAPGVSAAEVREKTAAPLGSSAV